MRTSARVYVLCDGSGALKIGHARDVEFRRTVLEREYARPLVCRHSTDVLLEAERIERTAHRVLRVDGKWKRAEWFNVSLAEAVSAIDRAKQIVELNLPLPALPDDKVRILAGLKKPLADRISDVHHGLRFRTQQAALRAIIRAGCEALLPKKKPERSK